MRAASGADAAAPRDFFAGCASLLLANSSSIGTILAESGEMEEWKCAGGTTARTLLILIFEIIHILIVLLPGLAYASNSKAFSPLTQTV